MSNTYVTDTTVWIEYFRLDGNDVTIRANVEKWIHEIISKQDSVIVVSTVVLCELIRRLFYVKRKNVKQIRTIIRTLTNSIGSIKVIATDNNSIHTIIETLYKLSNEKPCHIGELSLLPELIDLNAVVVSSDRDVLTAYKFVKRLDPHTDPPISFPAGVDFT